MKKPRIKPFDNSHPIYEEARSHCQTQFQYRGIHASSYKNKAYCSACNWLGTYQEYEKAHFVCPGCGCIDNTNGYNTIHCGTLLIDEVNNIIVFRFIGFTFWINEDGEHFEATEEYRIFTDGKEYEFCKKSGKSFSSMSTAEMSYNLAFREPDIYQYHNYDEYVQNNSFIKKLDILYDEKCSLSTIFSEIAQLAAKNDISPTCPQFKKPLPTNLELLATKYEKAHNAKHIVQKSKIGNAIQFDVWCGFCGEYHRKSEKANGYDPHLYLTCKCGERINGPQTYSSKRSLIVDMQNEINCTVLRFCEFSVTSSVIHSTNYIGIPAETTLNANINSLYFVCCYDDGNVIIFDEAGNPMTFLETEGMHFSSNIVNENIDEILNDNFVSRTGFSDFYKMSETFDMQYFFGYNRTAIADELIACNLHTLIYDIASPKVNAPAYLVKNNGKFTASMFTQEHFEDFALQNVTMDLFSVFMQIFKKDPTVTYGNFILLANASSKNYIADIYRKIPSASFEKIIHYISRLNSDEAIGPNESIALWCSYLQIAARLELDLTDDSIAYPQNLKKSYDLLTRKNRDNSYSQSAKLAYMETAKKFNVSYEDENVIIRPVASIDEYNNFKLSLMNTQTDFYQFTNSKCSLVFINKKTGLPKYLFDIDGIFVGDKFRSGTLVSILAFGNSVGYGRYRFARVIGSNPILCKLFNDNNIY